MANLNPFAEGRGGNLGTHSTERRVETVGLGWDIFLEYPIFGVGLGNFREVARQVYNDPFYRPPHNSYIWALSEGGIFTFLLFLCALLGDAAVISVGCNTLQRRRRICAGSLRRSNRACSSCSSIVSSLTCG